MRVSLVLSLETTITVRTGRHEMDAEHDNSQLRAAGYNQMDTA